MLRRLFGPAEFPPDKQYVSSHILRLLAVLLALLLVFYLLYHMGDGFQTKLETAFAKYASAAKTLELSGTVFRDETCITSDGGSVHYACEDGSKVAANQLLATVYPSLSSETRVAIAQIESLDRTIELLSEASARAQLLLNAEQTDKAITSALSHMSTERGKGDLAGAAEHAEELFLQLARKDLQQMSKKNYDDEIAKLTARRAVFESSLAKAGVPRYVRAGSAGGYFYRLSDGTESIYDYSSVMTMSISDFDNMHRAEGTLDTDEMTKNVIGKTVGSYKWYFVARTDRLSLDHFKVGRSYPVSFLSSDNRDVTMKLERTVTESGNSQALLVFSSSDLPEGFSFARHQSVSVTYDTVSGLRVSRSAVHMVNGCPFVYVMEGAQMYLRSVTVIDRVGGYYYVDPASEACTIKGGAHEGTYKGLRQGDCIIVYGIDLSHLRMFK